MGGTVFLTLTEVTIQKCFNFQAFKFSELRQENKNLTKKLLPAQRIIHLRIFTFHVF